MPNKCFLKIQLFLRGALQRMRGLQQNIFQRGIQKMEGYHNHTILEKSATVKIPFFQSSRFKLLMFGTILIAYGILFCTLFCRISFRLSDDIQDTVSIQSQYYTGYSSLAPLHLNLNNYLNLYTEEYLQRYEENKASFCSFIELLQSDDFGVYSHDLARICEKYLVCADEAITYRMQSDTPAMLQSLENAERIQQIISMFSAYSIKEIETAVNEKFAFLNHNMITQIQYTILALFIVTLILIGVAALFVHYFLSPLYRLTTLVKSVSTDSWQIQSPSCTRKDEMGILICAFYEMLNKLRRQFDELLQKQQLEKELQKEHEKSIRQEALLAKSQLRVFQSQINSHFLFNTLNVISRLGYLENAPRVQNASNLLAQFLRTTLNQFNHTVTLTEEFTTIENYLEIQKLRFGDRIQFDSDMDIDFEWFKIPSMTLQPLVENAFQHGVAGKKNGYIKYAAEKEDDTIFLYVWDDGKGMTSQRRLELLECLERDVTGEEVTDCIGLVNVYRRLNLCYPGKVTPVIESEPDQFCKIGFVIKLS